MTLQTIFYTVGIVAMLLWILVFILVTTGIYKVKKKTQNFKKNLKAKIASSAVGLNVVRLIFNKIKKRKRS